MAAARGAPSNAGQDRIYAFDEARLERLNALAPWRTNVKHFKKCKISALAAMKMLQHAIAGVDSGRKQGRPPIEIMGLCIGKADEDTIIVLDTCPLPVEGTETKVVADDTTNAYMAKLMESMEQRRKERFVGWYHSHPFDVTTYSHCHLSATDVQTQSLWQFQLPAWIAIVVDPLRSLARQEPEFGCYRCYPPEYNPPPNECPDGIVSLDEQRRVTRWGVTFHRYYQLSISYFMSSLGSRILDLMSRNSLWIRVLSSSSVMEPENRSRFPDRVRNATSKLEVAANQMVPHSRFGVRRKQDELSQAAEASAQLALEQVQGHVVQLAKDRLFNSSNGAASQ